MEPGPRSLTMEPEPCRSTLCCYFSPAPTRWPPPSRHRSNRATRDGDSPGSPCRLPPNHGTRLTVEPPTVEPRNRPVPLPHTTVSWPARPHPRHPARHASPLASRMPSTKRLVPAVPPRGELQSTAPGLHVAEPHRELAVLPVHGISLPP